MSLATIIRGSHAADEIPADFAVIAVQKLSRKPNRNWRSDGAPMFGSVLVIEE